jgi:hypothetical protein
LKSSWKAEQRTRQGSHDTNHRPTPKHLSGPPARAIPVQFRPAARKKNMGRASSSRKLGKTFTAAWSQFLGLQQARLSELRCRSLVNSICFDKVRGRQRGFREVDDLGSGGHRYLSVTGWALRGRFRPAGLFAHRLMRPKRPRVMRRWLFGLPPTPAPGHR